VLSRNRILKIAVAIGIIALISTTMIYLDSWPPMTVVASESMQHSGQWTYNSINTGDIVMIRHASSPMKQVVTYVNGSSSGYSTYGEYGNVIIYRAPNGENIIHRAIFYLEWKSGNPYVVGYNSQSWIKVTRNYILLSNIGFSHRNAVLYLKYVLNESGFITMGDHNLAYASSSYYNTSLNAYAIFDQDGIFLFNVNGKTITDPPVAPSWVVGIAFGEIPWFGLVKLNAEWALGLQKEQNPVPLNSYVYFFITISVVALASIIPGRKKDKSDQEIKAGRKP
jgi:signal peptidase